MNTLKSRFFYLTDEQWSKMVFDRIRQIPFSELEKHEDPAGYVEGLLEKEILYKTHFKPEEIDLTWGENWDSSGADRATGLLQAEVLLIRQMYLDKAMDVVELALEFRVSEEVIEQVLDGIIAPYLGGTLRPMLLAGANPDTAAYTTNQRLFCRGLVKVAKQVLDPLQFGIFARFNGMTLARANNVAAQLEEKDERIVAKRYCRVLRLCAEGKRLEEAIRADPSRGFGGKPGRPRKHRS